MFEFLTVIISKSTMWVSSLTNPRMVELGGHRLVGNAKNRRA